MTSQTEMNSPNPAGPPIADTDAESPSRLGVACGEEPEIPENLYREASIRLLRFEQAAATYVRSYKSPLFAYDCLLLARGWYTIVGCESEIELARRYRVRRQTVSKCVKAIQRQLGIGPMPGQKSECAVRTYREARHSSILQKPNEHRT